MAGSKDVNLTVGADTTALAAEMRKAAQDLKEKVSEMNETIGHLSEGFQKVQHFIAGISAALAGGAAFKHIIDSSVEWATEAQKLARALGITTEKASVYNTALHHLGIDSQVLIDGSIKMSKAIFTNSEAFETLGIKVKDSNGGFRSAGDVIEETIQRLASIKNPIEQNIAGVNLFGKGWAELRPVMKLTAEQMEMAEEHAKSLGLIVGPEGAARAKLYKESIRDLELVGHSLAMQIGNQMIPILTNLSISFTQEGPRAAEIFGNVLKGIIIVAATLWNSLQKVGLAIAAVAASAAMLVSGDYEGAKNVWTQFGADIDALDVKLADFYERMANPPPVKHSDGPDITDSGTTERLKKATGPDTRLEEWRGQLEALKQASDEYRKNDILADIDYWERKLALVRGNGAKDQALRLKLQHELYSLNQKYADENKKSDEQYAASKRALALIELDTEREKLRERVELGLVTRSEELAKEKEFENRKFEIERKALDDRLTLVMADKLARQKVMDEIAQLEAQHQLNTLKLDNQTTSETFRHWTDFFHGIQSGFQSVITGFLQGTRTVASLMRGIFDAVIGSVANVLAGIAAQWLAKQLLMRVAGKVTALSVIGEEAAKAGAGGTASMAAAPFPLNLTAPAFGASMAALALGYGPAAAASGGYDIPGGVNPMVQAHAKEMILPQDLSDKVRNMTEGSGGAVHYHINAVDTKSFLDMVNRDRAGFHQIMKKATRESSPGMGM